MNEFELIAACFKPLAGSGSLNLSDDAALLAVPPGESLVATADALAAGVHFLGDEDAALIARKALRVNLSDLASMGARPLHYLLCLMLPRGTPDAWVQRFAEGLAADQETFGIALAGGDTISTPGPLSIAITALGCVPEGGALLRSGACARDAVYVSGTLGDAALGLACLRGELPRSDALEHRYLLPQPRLTLGLALRGIASACMDISDGLVQDLGHICAASHTGAVIHAPALPLSAAARLHGDRALHAALSGGDDYELLFTVPPAREHLLTAATGQTGIKVTRIGEITPGGGVRAVSGNGIEIPFQSSGFKHHFS